MQIDAHGSSAVDEVFCTAFQSPTLRHDIIKNTQKQDDIMSIRRDN